MSYTITTDTTGQIGVNPRIIKVVAEANTLAEVTAAGFLASNGTSSINAILPTDIVLVKYLDNVSFFKPTISSAGVITLSADSADVALPTTVDYFATYANTDGGIKNGSTTATNPGNIHAGLSNVAGSVSSYPAAAAKGSLRMTAVPNTGDTITTISNAAMGQASVVSIPDPATATANFAVAPAALVNNNLVKASGTAGLVADAGHKILSGVTSSWGGGSTTNTFTIAGVTTATRGSISLGGTTTNIVSFKFTFGTGGIDVTFSADPGAFTYFNYIFTNVAAT